MIGLSGLRLYGTIGAAAAVAFMTWATVDRFSLAGKLSDLRAEVASCERAAGDITRNLDDCPDNVALGLEYARASSLCDAALDVPNALSTVRAQCSAPVKRVVAERDAAAQELVSTREALDQARSDQTAAVRRAEARGAAQATRKDRSDAAIEAAPGAGDDNGDLRRCDAQCLRDLG